MSKFYKLFLLLGFAFAISAYAIPKDPCLPQDICCEDPAPGPYTFSYPKDVGLVCPRDFYAHGEFLWMKPSEEGLEYAMEQDAATEYTFPLENGKIKDFSSGSQEWDWRPGFRVGFGFYNNFDSWNIDVNWTYLRIKADSETEITGTDLALLLLLYPITFNNLSVKHASSRWSGDFNTLDLMVGKPYHVSRYYVSNPMFGIRAAWIDQDYHVRYFIFYAKQNVFHKNDYWAAGLRGAYEGDFLLGSGWLVYGKAAFALLFGKFDTSQSSDFENVDIPLAKYKIENSFYSVQPNAELSMGLSWSKFFHKDQYKVALKVGYEYHQWWDQNQLRKFFDFNPVATDTVSRGDLSFNGFMFGLHIDF